MPEKLTNNKSTLVQAIAWAKVDSVLCRHVASLGPNELNQSNPTPGRCGSNFAIMIFKLIIQNSSLGTH